MPFTELVTPTLKQDDDTRDMFVNRKSTILAPLISSIPSDTLFSGLMTIENGINVESELKFVLGIEWEKQEHFKEFITSETFKAFGGTVKPFVLVPPQPQLYETDSSPKAVFYAPVTEVFRIVKHENGNEIEKAWKDFSAALKSTTGGINQLSGSSVNLESEMFTGVVGWDSLDVRETILKDEEVVRTREKLENIPQSDYFLTKFSPLE